MMGTRPFRPAIWPLLVLGILVAGCQTFLETERGLVPTLSFEPGANFSGAFFVGETLPKNTPTVVAIVAIPTPTLLGAALVTLECAAVPPLGANVPRKFILGWNVTDTDGLPLGSEKIRAKLRPDGNCKSKKLRLDLSEYPAGSMIELTLEARGRPLVESTHVAYEIGVS